MTAPTNIWTSSFVLRGAANTPIIAAHAAKKRGSSQTFAAQVVSVVNWYVPSAAFATASTIPCMP